MALLFSRESKFILCFLLSSFTYFSVAKADLLEQTPPQKLFVTNVYIHSFAMQKFAFGFGRAKFSPGRFIAKNGETELMNLPVFIESKTRGLDFSLIETRMNANLSLDVATLSGKSAGSAMGTYSGAGINLCCGAGIHSFSAQNGAGAKLKITGAVGGFAAGYFRGSLVVTPYRGLSIGENDGRLSSAGWNEPQWNDTLIDGRQTR